MGICFLYKLVEFVSNKYCVLDAYLFMIYKSVLEKLAAAAPKKNTKPAFFPPKTNKSPYNIKRGMPAHAFILVIKFIKLMVFSKADTEFIKFKVFFLMRFYKPEGFWDCLLMFQLKFLDTRFINTGRALAEIDSVIVVYMVCAFQKPF